MPFISSSSIAVLRKITLLFVGCTCSPDRSPNRCTNCITRGSWLASRRKTVESSTNAEKVCSAPFPPGTGILLSCSSCWIAIASTSAARMNRSGASRQPCRIPEMTSWGSDNSPFTRNRAVVPSWRRLIIRTNSGENPNFSSVRNRNSRATVS
ncbi:hypothetical protein PR003_g1616 [Phytophthora rubi]|uniref:Secreted protein n=1 Tax=Phytophthora rubi TaxID=129364 RepID=A0A6A3PGM5_9STRA|nr:hypothetical protein PR002_g1497 [Phytophthora rubi]KAE9051859.1 hypothetical protein PR001_g1027 [Phytophthora rubi]KAE9357786.1 hypothetical protein PR003_g1616 [Phytophthora rubi]